MAQVNPSLGILGGQRGDGETFDRAALNALLAEFNGNIDATNLKAAAALLEAQLTNGANGLAKGAFSAYRNTAASLTTASPIVFDAEIFDVSNWHDITTGRYTPQVPGYYRFSWACTPGANQPAGRFWAVSLAKNGTLINVFSQYQGALGSPAVGGSAIAQANGSTDFFQVVLSHDAGAATAISAGSSTTYFQGELIGRS